MGFIAADRNQVNLFGYSLDDFVPPEAKCRFVVELVGQLDLSALYADYSDQGGDAYDPRTMLASWFFAYSEGISSTRRLEHLCRRDMHYIYVSANLQPDHCALSRFRQRHAHRLPEFFVQIIRLAKERDVSQFRRIMTDGSKMEAVASSRQNRGSDELQTELVRLKEQIADYLEQSELLDEQEYEEALELAQVRSKMQKLAQMEARLLERQQQLQERKKTLQSKDRSRHKINLVEPEARSMKQVNGRPAAPAYNAQLSVDAESHLIVAAEVTDDPNDRNQFSRQHAQVEKNLGADCERQYTADAGYHSLEQLEYADERKADVVIADPRPATRAAADSEERRQREAQEVFKRADFRYDREADEYECPAGGRLTYWYTENKRGRRIRHYRAGGCTGCGLRDRCMKGCKPDSDRTITRDEAEHLAEAMSRKATSPGGWHRLKERATTVEPVIGNLKSNLGFRRFRLRGKAKAGAEFVLMCIGHNLGKLHGLMKGRGRHGATVAATVPTAFASFCRCLKGITHRTWSLPAPSLAHAL